LETEFCVDALNEAIHKFGPPDIMNTDQGSQFTSFVWTDGSRRSNVRISIDGKGRSFGKICQKVDRRLQSQMLTFRTWRQTTCCDLLAEKQNTPPDQQVQRVA